VQSNTRPAEDLVHDKIDQPPGIPAGAVITEETQHPEILAGAVINEKPSPPGYQRER
jgi:hypothetical protein